MTLSLEKAFAEAALLSEAAQEQLAAQLIEEIRGELQWDATLAHSQNVLESLAEKARQAQQQGLTTSKGFDEL